MGIKQAADIQNEKIYHMSRSVYINNVGIFFLNCDGFKNVMCCPTGEPLPRVMESFKDRVL